MAGTQDPLTDLPPPSRLDFDELSNFNFDAAPAPAPPPPFISWTASTAAIHGNIKSPLRPRILLVASSASGCHLIHHLPNKHLLGFVILPEAALSAAAGNRDGHSEQACSLYSLDGQQGSVVLVAVQKSVPEERTHAWARVLLEAIVPESLLMVATVQREHFRGKLSADDHVVFRLETDRQRLQEEGDSRFALPYFPTGSLVAGLPAAILTRCQIRGLKARLLLSWPDAGPSAPSLLLSVLQSFPEAMAIDFTPALLVPFKRKSVSDLDIYF